LSVLFALVPLCWFILLLYTHSYQKVNVLVLEKGVLFQGFTAHCEFGLLVNPNSIYY
jgi:hypothetical protein